MCSKVHALVNFMDNCKNLWYWGLLLSHLSFLRAFSSLQFMESQCSWKLKWSTLRSLIYYIKVRLLQQLYGISYIHISTSKKNCCSDQFFEEIWYPYIVFKKKFYPPANFHAINWKFFPLSKLFYKIKKVDLYLPNRSFKPACLLES